MTTTTPSTTELERKVDGLSAQLDFIAAELREQRIRRQQWDELRADLSPLGGEALAMASRELEEVQAFVDLEDVLSLAKRVIRNTRNIEATLERLESAIDLVEDMTPLGKAAFLRLLTTLDEYERRGYFTFAEATLGVIDRVVTNFTSEDVEQLGDNVVLILETVKEMTQPEIMAVLYRMIEAVQRQQAAMAAEPTEPPSTWQLLNKMRDPDVRRGLGRALDTVSAVSTIDLGPPRAFVPETNQQANEHQGGA